MRKFLSAAAAVAVTLSSMPVAMAMQAEMSSNSMMKSGMHRVERVSRRTVTARARAASAKVRDKCKALTGLQRAACLNPKLKNKAMKKDAMEAMK